MNCEQFSALVDGFLDGTLSETQKAECAHHLEACADCRLHQLILSDSRTLDEQEEPPEGFSAAWRQAVHCEEARPSKAPEVSGGQWRRYVALAASLLLITGGVLTVEQWRGRKDKEPQMYAAAPPDDAGAEIPLPVMEAAFSSNKSITTGGSLAPDLVRESKRMVPLAQRTLRLESTSPEEDLAKLHDLAAKMGASFPIAEEAAGHDSSLTIELPIGAVEEFLARAGEIAELLPAANADVRNDEQRGAAQDFVVLSLYLEEPGQVH